VAELVSVGELIPGWISLSQVRTRGVTASGSSGRVARIEREPAFRGNDSWQWKYKDAREEPVQPVQVHLSAPPSKALKPVAPDRVSETSPGFEVPADTIVLAVTAKLERQFPPLPSKRWAPVLAAPLTYGIVATPATAPGEFPTYKEFSLSILTRLYG